MDVSALMLTNIDDIDIYLWDVIIHADKYWWYYDDINIHLWDGSVGEQDALLEVEALETMTRTNQRLPMTIIMMILIISMVIVSMIISMIILITSMVILSMIMIMVI